MEPQEPLADLEVEPQEPLGTSLVRQEPPGIRRMGLQDSQPLPEPPRDSRLDRVPVRLGIGRMGLQDSQPLLEPPRDSRLDRVPVRQ